MSYQQEKTEGNVKNIKLRTKKRYTYKTYAKTTMWCTCSRN